MKYKGWLIYNKEDGKRNNAYIEWMLEEADNLNLNLRLIYKEDLAFGVKSNRLCILHNNKEATVPDFVICRNIDSIFTKQLEYMGVKTFNNSFVSEICNNKAKTHQYLAQFDIPMLNTYFFRVDEFMPEKIKLQYPLVIKEVDGRGGKQVYKAENLNELKEIRAKLESKEIILQPMGEVPGKDVRVFVVGKNIVAAILRSSNTDFRANYSLGGSAKIYNLSENERELVNKIISKFDFGLVGIDFIFDKNGGFIFNEIEDVVGSRTLSKNTDINLVNIYLKYIIEQLS